MIKVDACGLDCPKPVIMTKKALEESDKIQVCVDNKVAADNVSKLAQKMNSKVVMLEDDGIYTMNIIKVKGDVNTKKSSPCNKVYFIKSNYLGDGSEELGEVLMKGFISTLLEMDPLPEHIIFMNTGVKVPTLNSEAKESLAKLEEKGVSVLVCGTCLDYYNLKEELEIGSISNMYEILDVLNQGNVVSI